MGKRGTVFLLPPPDNGIYGKLRRLGRGTDRHVSQVVSEIVNAIGYGPTHRVLAKVVDIDFLCFSTPSPTRVLEVANQFLFLGIYTDYRIPSGPEDLFHPLNVPELTISIRMWRAGRSFPVGFQRVAQILQQTPDCHVADMVLAQGFAQMT
jgi:hypothetical protein